MGRYRSGLSGRVSLGLLKEERKNGGREKSMESH